MPPDPAAGSATLARFGFLQQQELRVARDPPREGVGQAERGGVGSAVDGIRAADAGGEHRDRRAQQVHVQGSRCAIMRHAVSAETIGGLGFQPAGRLDPHP